METKVDDPSLGAPSNLKLKQAWPTGRQTAGEAQLGPRPPARTKIPPALAAEHERSERGFDLCVRYLSRRIQE